MSDPVELTTRYATTVDELSDAFSFVMSHLDHVGSDPTISIGPVWSFNDLSDVPLRRFAVMVSGMVPNPKETT